MSNRGGVRGPVKLTAEQQVALDHARAADDAWRNAKLTLKARLRQQLEEELQRYAIARDKAVYDAAVGHQVPKNRLANEALRTSPNAVYDAIQRHSELAGTPGLPELAAEPKPRFRWEKLDDLDGGASMWALLDEHTDHTAEFEKWHVEGGWLLADNPLNGKRFWFRGMPGPDVLAWVEKNAPKGDGE